MDAKVSRARSLLLAPAVCLLTTVVGCGGRGPNPDPRPSNQAEVAIRDYLGNEFSDEDWYPVGPVTVRRHVAMVPTSLGGGARGRSEAVEVCLAVLGSHQVGRVVVRYGRGLTEDCS